MLKITEGKNIGTFGVRTVGLYGEKVLHAPRDTKGRFDLIVMPDGELRYRPAPIPAYPRD